MNNNNGFCECGCKGLAPICTHTDKRTKDVKGQACRYIRGHQAHASQTPSGHGYRFIDLTKQVFGRLTVLEYAGVNRWGQALWKCVCKCGNIVLVAASSLKRGGTISCGCYRTEQCHIINRTHGQTHSATYSTWHAMIQRCTNPNKDNWHRYGGATPPVLVDPKWLTFEGFFEDKGERPEGTTLGRFGDIGNYIDDNTEWMTKEEQEHEAFKKYSLRTHCIHGHARTPESLTAKGWCRVCQNLAAIKSRHAAEAAKKRTTTCNY